MCKICMGTITECLNVDTYAYCGLRIELLKGGYLRVQQLGDEGELIAAEVIKISYCPDCGTKLGGEHDG